MLSDSPREVWLSAGEWCLAAHQLKRIGLRENAYPFDWSFHSLEHVTLALKNQLPLRAIFDGHTPGPVFSQEKHYIMTFPHKDLMRDFETIIRRWENLLQDAMARKVQVCWLYVTRENDTRVQEKLDHFMAEMPFENYKILHVHYHTWKENSKKVNRIEWHHPLPKLTTVHAYISHAWDGDNWNARDHQELWDQILAQYKK